MRYIIALCLALIAAPVAAQPIVPLPATGNLPPGVSGFRCEGSPWHLKVSATFILRPDSAIALQEFRIPGPPKMAFAFPIAGGLDAQGVMRPGVIDGGVTAAIVGMVARFAGCQALPFYPFEECWPTETIVTVSVQDHLEMFGGLGSSGNALRAGLCYRGGAGE